jgi:hypothetical protein
MKQRKDKQSDVDEPFELALWYWKGNAVRIAWGVALILPAATHEPATNAMSC